MRIYAIVEKGGEGKVRAFASDVRALAAAKKAGGTRDTVHTCMGFIYE